MMASQPASDNIFYDPIRLAQARLVGTVQSIVDLYERQPEMAFRRLAKAVSDYEDVVLAGRS